MKFHWGNIKQDISKLIPFLKFKEKKKAKPEEEEIPPEEIEDIDKKLLKDKLRLEGEKAALKVEKEILEKELDDSKKINMAKVLSEQEEKLRFQDYVGAFSLRRFFQDVEKIDKINKRKPIRVLTYNSSKELGIFKDIIILKDGRFCLIVKPNNPLLSAKNIKDLFRNYKGLSYIASRGFLQVNLDKEGKYVENALEREVPDIIIDANGKRSFKTKISEDTFTNKLAEKDEEINALMTDLETMEKAYIDERREKEKAKQQKRVNQTRADTAETELSKSLTKMNKIHMNMKDLVEENEEFASKVRLLENKLEDYEDRFGEISKKFAEYLGSDSTQISTKELKKTIKWLMKEKIIKPEKIIVETKPEEKKPEEKKLE